MSKAGLLAEVNTGLELLRFQLRLARDLAALPNQGHGHAIERMSGVGTQVGGWLKSLRARGAGQASPVSE